MTTKRLIECTLMSLMIFLAGISTAASCKSSGCTKYALRNGYCELHQAEAKQNTYDRNGTRNLFNRKTKGTEEGKNDLEQKPFSPGSLKSSQNEYNLYKCFDLESRKWKDSKGREMSGRWTACTKDESVIYVKDDVSEKYRRVFVSGLSDDDQKYVKNRLDSIHKKKLIWSEGCFFTKENLQGIKKAEDLVVARSPKGAAFYKIFQILDFGALANFGKVVYGNVYYSGETFFLADNVQGVISDTEELYRQLFWASTYTYTNKMGDTRTVAKYTSSFVTAVKYVRAEFGLYDTEDDDYESFERYKGRGSKTAEGEGVKPPVGNGDILQCTGSGFFITKDGYLVTNNHVVQGGRRFKVLSASGMLDAQVVKCDPETDLALLKVDASVRSIVFSSSRRERLGTEIFTMGFPQPGLQGFSPKVTKGVVSGMDGFKGDTREYQIDATIQPGNSGGPLFNMNGNVVGVIVASLRNGQAVNYAIKKSYLLAFLDGATDCADKIEEEHGACVQRPLEAVVDDVRESCALILNYK